jgi:hypothetical protein
VNLLYTQGIFKCLQVSQGDYKKLKSVTNSKQPMDLRRQRASTNETAQGCSHCLWHIGVRLQQQMEEQKRKMSHKDMR